MIEPKAFFTTGHYKNADRAPRYDNHSFSTVPLVVFHPTMTAAVRRDVQNVLATSPTLHTDAKKRWERWKRSRSNQAR